MSEWSTRDFLTRDKEKRTGIYIAKKVSNIAMNTFITEIDGLDAHIEYFLWDYGICGLWKHPIIGYVVTPLSIAGYDINGIPNKWKPIIKNDMIPASLPNLGVDDVIVFYDTPSPFIYRKQCLSWVEDYSDVTETIRQQVWNQKTPLIGIAGSKGLASKMNNVIKSIGNNLKALVLDQDFKDNLKPLDFNAPFNVEMLYAYRKSIENEMLEYCGVDNKDGFIKKERLIVDEQEGNDELLNNILNGCLMARQKAIDRLPEFGFTGSTKINGIVRPIEQMENGIDGEDK